MPDRIEILSAALPRQEPMLGGELRNTADAFGVSMGWHYMLDLTWIAREVERVRPRLVLDAGAGRGAMQWWLAGRGIDVISVDRAARPELASRLRARKPSGS